MANETGPETPNVRGIAQQSSENAHTHNTETAHTNRPTHTGLTYPLWMCMQPCLRTRPRLATQKYTARGVVALSSLGLFYNHTYRWKGTFGTDGWGGAVSSG